MVLCVYFVCLGVSWLMEVLRRYGKRFLCVFRENEMLGAYGQELSVMKLKYLFLKSLYE